MARVMPGISCSCMNSPIIVSIDFPSNCTLELPRSARVTVLITTRNPINKQHRNTWRSIGGFLATEGFGKGRLRTTPRGGMPPEPAKKGSLKHGPPKPIRADQREQTGGGLLPVPGDHCRRATAGSRSSRQRQRATRGQRATRDWPPGGRPHRSGRRPAKRKRAGRPCFACRCRQGWPVAPHATQKPPGGRLSEHSRHTLAVPPNASSLKGPGMALQALFTVSRRACGRRSCATADRGTRCVPTRR